MDTNNEHVDRLVRRLHSEGVVEMDETILAALLDCAVVEREVNTSLAGPIRVLTLGSEHLLQEQTTEGQALVRAIDSEDEADRLIADRLEAYERMWDG